MTSTLKVDKIETLLGSGNITIANNNNLIVQGAIRDTTGSARGGFYQGNQGSVGDTAAKGNIFRINNLTLSANTTIAANEGASCVGPLTVANNIILTVNGEMVVN